MGKNPKETKYEKAPDCKFRPSDEYSSPGYLTFFCNNQYDKSVQEVGKCTSAHHAIDSGLKLEISTQVPQTKFYLNWAVVVAQLVERSLLTPEISYSNPNISKNRKSANKEKEDWIGPLKSSILKATVVLIAKNGKKMLLTHFELFLSRTFLSFAAFAPNYILP